MKNYLLILLISIWASCSSQPIDKKSEGEIVGIIDAQTFHAKYTGPNLKIGDRVSIFTYEDFEDDLKEHQSRSLPLKKKKVFLGEVKVSSKLNGPYYELKSSRPQHIPNGASLEKL